MDKGKAPGLELGPFVGVPPNRTEAKEGGEGIPQSGWSASSVASLCLL